MTSTPLPILAPSPPMSRGFPGTKADGEHGTRCRLTIVLPTDYREFGGTVDRWQEDALAYPDCSGGCRHFRPLHDHTRHGEDLDWGVCVNPNAPRAGLLTFEHQAGVACWSAPDDEASPWIREDASTPPPPRAGH